MLEPTSTSADLLGECHVRPRAILVHDPVAAGAFREFDSVQDDSRLEGDLLFRARPDPTPYAEHHLTMVRTIAAHADRVIYLSELIGGEPAFQLAFGNPNQVFTRDSLITLPWAPDAYFRSRMKPEQRRRESETMRSAVERLGLRDILQLPDNIFLEGGDVIPFSYDGKRCLLVGYGPRSTPEAIDFLQQALLPDHADELLAIRLAPWRMNLDGGFVPVSSDVIVADTQSIVAADLVTASGRTSIRMWEMTGDLGIRVIDATPEESVYAQACNCLCLGGRTIVCYDLCPRVVALLRAHEIQVFTIPGRELIKGRGGPRCMTRPIYRAPATGA